MDIKEVMRRQYGPMPVWAWTALAASFIAGVVVFRKRMSPAKTTGAEGNGGSTGGPAGEFNSGQSTTTTDANGNQITTQYNASGPLTGFPGYLTNQAGPMPYSGGDVYVNYPNVPTSPPAQQTQAMRQTLDVNKFNANTTTAGAPWYMLVANPGETWQDVSARMYGFADNFAKITDPKVQQQVQNISKTIQNMNNAPGSTGAGPAPYQVVFFH